MHFRSHRRPDPADERLLRAGPTPGEFPTKDRGLANFVDALRSPARAGDLVADPKLVAAIASEVRAGAAQRAPTARHRSVRARGLAARIAVAATGVLGVTAAGAAAGALPGPAQATIAGALSHVGVSVPDPSRHDGHAHTDASTTATTSRPASTPRGPGATGARATEGGRDVVATDDTPTSATTPEAAHHDDQVTAPEQTGNHDGPPAPEYQGTGPGHGGDHVTTPASAPPDSGGSHGDGNGGGNGQGSGSSGGDGGSSGGGDHGNGGSGGSGRGGGNGGN